MSFVRLLAGDFLLERGKAYSAPGKSDPSDRHERDVRLRICRRNMTGSFVSSSTSFSFAFSWASSWRSSLVEQIREDHRAQWLDDLFAWSGRVVHQTEIDEGESE